MKILIIKVPLISKFDIFNKKEIIINKSLVYHIAYFDFIKTLSEIVRINPILLIKCLNGTYDIVQIEDDK